MERPGNARRHTEGAGSTRTTPFRPAVGPRNAQQAAQAGLEGRFVPRTGAIADHLKKIFGTEEDPLNCAFFFKVGACHNGDMCGKRHNRPTISQTLMLAHMYCGTVEGLAVTSQQEWDDRMYDQAQTHLEDFYREVFVELAKYGEVEDVVVVDNTAKHMVGNVYVKFYRAKDAARALQGLTGRYYKGQLIVPQFTMVQDFQEARCRAFHESYCNRVGNCKFLHIKHIPMAIKRRVVREMYRRHPHYMTETRDDESSYSYSASPCRSRSQRRRGDQPQLEDTASAPEAPQSQPPQEPQQPRRSSRDRSHSCSRERENQSGLSLAKQTCIGKAPAAADTHGAGALADEAVELQKDGSAAPRNGGHSAGIDDSSGLYDPLAEPSEVPAGLANVDADGEGNKDAAAVASTAIEEATSGRRKRRVKRRRGGSQPREAGDDASGAGLQPSSTAGTAQVRGGASASDGEEDFDSPDDEEVADKLRRLGGGLAPDEPQLAMASASHRVDHRVEQAGCADFDEADEASSGVEPEPRQEDRRNQGDQLERRIAGGAHDPSTAKGAGQKRRRRRRLQDGEVEAAAADSGTLPLLA